MGCSSGDARPHSLPDASVFRDASAFPIEIDAAVPELDASDGAVRDADRVDLRGIERFLERLVREQGDDNLVIDVAQGADGGHVVTFEDGPVEVAAVDVVRHVDVQDDAWSVRFELADGTDVTAPYLGDGLPIDDADIVVDPFGTAPLSAVLSVTLPAAGQLSIRVHGQDGPASDWKLPARAHGKKHTRPIVGLYADADNEVTVTFTRRDATVRRSKTFTLATRGLHHAVPLFIVRKPYAMPEQNMGFLLNYRTLNYPLLTDAFGKVRWMLKSPEVGTRRGMQRLQNGNFAFASVQEHVVRVYSWVGELLEDIAVPAPWKRPHHDLVEMPNGNFLVTVEETGAETVEDIIIELDRASGQVVHVWDLKDVLPQDHFDLRRDPRDWVHVNGVVYDARDDTLIVSSQRQGVFKVTRDNEVKWLLGRDGWPAELQASVLTLSPGTETVWGQHAPELLPNGNVIVFDNGPGREYGAAAQFSRIVEYRIDAADVGGTATQVFEYGRNRPELFSPMVSDVDAYASGNRLMVSGAPTREFTYVSPTEFSAKWVDTDLVKAWITEVDPRGNIEFEMTVQTASTASGSVYRAEKLVLTP
jgi:arylsulfate sulfotransferase